MKTKFEFLFSKESYDDLNTIEEFYLPIKEELLEDVKEEILKYLEFIKEHPFSFQKRHKDIRACFTPRFHFGIYFSIDEVKNMIYIVGIINTKEDLLKIINRTK